MLHECKKSNISILNSRGEESGEFDIVAILKNNKNRYIISIYECGLNDKEMSAQIVSIERKRGKLEKELKPLIACCTNAK